MKYVTKEETRVGALPDADVKFPSQPKLWKMWSSFIQEQLRQFPNHTAEELTHCLATFDAFIRSAIKDG